MTGGARIWLKRIKFPSRFPPFVRFGTAVVPTVSLHHLTLEPNLIKILRPFRQQHSYLSFAPRSFARNRWRYAIEGSPDKQAGVWNEYRKV